ncbi:MAG: glycosyltransferase family 1 protein [Stagnimonas sp.]|nr:glycosyltransferase family 1 protein [Stagnimonas sp.]
MSQPDPVRILMELRTCFEGFAGIPQETRLLFSAFLDMPALKVDGLINHTGQRLGKALEPGGSYEGARTHKRYDRLSQFVASTLEPESRSGWAKAQETVLRELLPWGLAAKTKLGMDLKLHRFDPAEYSDFLWETFFAASLPPNERGKIGATDYRTLSMPWRAMHRAGLVGGQAMSSYPTVDTRGYDIVISQTPYPARLPQGSQLLVRYHDAIPMFQTHTIPTARFHAKSHYRALLDNASHAVFACTSNSVRKDLLTMFPALEKRSRVIHDVVSHSYSPEPVRVGAAAEIIRSRLNPKTEPRWGSSSGATSGSNSPHLKAQFYEQHLLSKPLRYLLMVSSIEPRKNHMRLMRAWEALRMRGDSDLKLVFVGAIGWHVENLLNALKPWQERGALFHLSNVPVGDMRQLFAAAECVVCPSVAEGFDLSGIEAMLCGGAVAASDIPVHREVYGDSAEYFDKYSVSEIADCIGRLIDPARKSERAALQQRGIAHAQQYKREVIAPQWGELFSRIRAGDFAAGLRP